MSTEECKLCGKDSTPWAMINGHICGDCYSRDKWISVADRLPKLFKSVLVVITEKELTHIQLAHLTYVLDSPDKKLWYIGEDWNNDYVSKLITHWMPLPQPPEIK